MGIHRVWSPAVRKCKRRGGSPKPGWSCSCTCRWLLLPQNAYLGQTVLQVRSATCLVARCKDMGISISLPAWTTGWCSTDALFNDKRIGISWYISMKESLLLSSLGNFPLDFDSTKAYQHACTRGDWGKNSSHIKVLKSVIFLPFWTSVFWHDSLWVQAESIQGFIYKQWRSHPHLKQCLM